MASPTPTGDPVTTTSPTPVSDPVTSDRPVKPIMGNVVSLSKDDWSAWTGGKPLAGWIGLDPSASDEITSPNQLRPVHAGASQKGYNYRRTGLPTPFSPTSSLIDFQNAVWDHLTDCGMDSIAYLPDPENELLMTNVVKSHSRYTIQTAKALSAEQLMLYDKYDKSNDRAAVKFVLSSLSPALMSKIQEKTEDSDSFHIVWLQLIKTIQSTSIERFEDLKAAIKARHPSQYAGENLELLASDFRKDARELTTAGQYDHNLTLTMLKTFLLAGGSGNEDFRFQLRATKQKLDQALLDIGYKEKSAAQAHMVSEKLTYQDVCRQAEDAYRLQYDRKEWPPASHATDTRVPSATFGNVALPEGSPITRAEVLNLIQSQTPRQDAPKKGNCHNCGKPGHWSNKCPDKNKNNRKNVSGNGTPNNATGAHKTQSWRTVPPPPGTATSKKVKDKAFNWCEKCRRWTTTHTTATHTGQRRNNASAPAPSAQANLSAFSIADPSVWMLDFDDPSKKSQPTAVETICSLLFSKATTLLVYSVILCLAVPKFANLALQVLRSTPWMSFLTWVADSLRQVLREQPTLLFAPALWFALLAAPFGSRTKLANKKRTQTQTFHSLASNADALRNS
ncbi:hypothetical protein MHU86_7783 [Fragilaria crotonensis]|nr:hypothetical protein MHU86_7783 [Fragilaria crotonensis]